MIPANSIRGRKRKLKGISADEERQSLEMLAAFRKRLDEAPQKDAPEPVSPVGNGEGKNGENKADGGDEEAALCDLHFIANCQSCSKWDDDAIQSKMDNDEGSAGWMSHALNFEKDRLGKDLTWKRKNEEELIVIDPREKSRDIREERMRERGKPKR